MQKLTILLLILGFGVLSSYGQTDHKGLYRKAFDEQHQMLKEEIPIDFKRAVFITENVYYKGTLDYRTFKSKITQTGNKLKNLIKHRGLTGESTDFILIKDDPTQDIDDLYNIKSIWKMGQYIEPFTE